MMKHKDKIAIIIITTFVSIIFAIVLVVVIFILRSNSQIIESEDNIHDTQTTNPDTTEIKLMKRNCSNISLDDLSNITIDDSFSAEEREVLDETLLKIQFPIERLGNILITSSPYEGNEINMSSLAHVIEDPESSTLIIEFNRSWYWDDMGRTLVHELGHVYNKKLGEGTLLFEYKEIRDIPSEITYDTEIEDYEDWQSDFGEDFAEIFVAYYYDSEYKIRTVYDPNIYEDRDLLEFFNDKFQVISNRLTAQEIESGQKITAASLEALEEYPGRIFIPKDQIHEEITFWVVNFNEGCIDLQAEIENIDNLTPSEIFTSYHWQVCPINHEIINKYPESGWYDLIESPASTNQEKPAYVLLSEEYVHIMYFGQYYKTIKDEDKPQLEKAIKSFQEI